METADRDVRGLYQEWIQSWNEKDAIGMGEILEPSCNMVGFDGSQMNGRDEIVKTLEDIFKQYPTARFVNIIEEVRFIEPNVAVLRAIAGMVPRGYQDLNPQVNAIQTLIANKQNGEWKISVFQNTPAAFHGRPELVEAMSEKLRQRIKDLPKEQ